MLFTEELDLSCSRRLLYILALILLLLLVGQGRVATMHRLQIDLMTQLEEGTEKQKPRFSSSKRFRPFQKERDAMNRLIRPQSTKRLIITRANTEQPHAHHEKEDVFQHKFDQFFKVDNVFADCQPRKHKLQRKQTLQILEDRQKYGQKRQSTRQTTSQSESSVEPSIFNKFSKTQSVQFTKVPLGRPLPIVQTHNSEVVSLKKTGSSLNCSPKAKKSEYYQSEISIEENIKKGKQLHRYHRMRQLEIKLLPNFQRAHKVFLGKMMKSKQLAFEVKTNLNKIDDILN